jgi:hypothetical protein
MKSIKLILSAGFFVLAAISCSNSLSPTSKNEGKVTFQTTQRSYGLHDTITAVLQNHSAKNISYNLCTSMLQQKKGRKWSFAGPATPCNLIAYIMKPGGRAKYQLALNNKGKRRDNLIAIPHLSPGTYRLKTSVTVGKYDDHSIHTHPFHVGIKN